MTYFLNRQNVVRPQQNSYRIIIAVRQRHEDNTWWVVDRGVTAVVMETETDVTRQQSALRVDLKHDERRAVFE